MRETITMERCDAETTLGAGDCAVGAVDLSPVVLDPSSFDSNCMKLASRIWNMLVSRLDRRPRVEGQTPHVTAAWSDAQCLGLPPALTRSLVVGVWSDGETDGCREVTLWGNSRLTWDPLDGYVFDGEFDALPELGGLELVAEIDHGGVVMQLVRVTQTADHARVEEDYGRWLLKSADDDSVLGRYVEEVVTVIESVLRG